jgi:hypothetical protein
MPARAIRAVAALALIPVLFVAGCGPGSARAEAGAAVRLPACDGSRPARPDLVQVVCASDAIMARRLAWSAWGKPVATAVGEAVVDLCAFEDCHTGSYSAVPIVLVASKLVTCPKGVRAYTRLQYVFVGTSPFQGLPANMNYSNFMFGSARAGMPRDQTVQFAC